MKPQSTLGKMSYQARSRLMPGAAQWWCHVPVVAEGGLSRGCSRKDADALFSGGEAWYVAAVSATDLVPKGVTFKPISHYNLRAKRRA